MATLNKIQKYVLSHMEDRDVEGIYVGRNPVTKAQVKSNPATALELYRLIVRGDFSRDINHQFKSIYREMSYLRACLNHYGAGTKGGIGYYPSYAFTNKTPAEELVSGIVSNLKRKASK